MKALTLYQPWASLVALNVKRIETRSWSTKYRGPLAIHASKKEMHLLRVGEWSSHVGFDRDRLSGEIRRGGSVNDGELNPGRFEQGLAYPMPLGAVVATCELVDVVPIVEDIPPQDEWHEPWSVVTVDPWPILNTWPGWGSVDSRCISDQRPYGDYTPGRFAWLLTDIKPLPEPIPAKGKQGLWEWTP